MTPDHKPIPRSFPRPLLENTTTPFPNCFFPLFLSLPQVVQPKVMAVINVVNGCLVILVGVLYFLFLPSLSVACGACISEVLCGLYCVLNGLIFINFSTGCIKGLNSCNRKNFGFMYTFYGRFFFVVFCGSLCFGLKDPTQKTVVGNVPVFGYHWLGILTGVLSWISALFNVWAMCNYPEYSLDRGGMLTPRTTPNEGGNVVGIPMEERFKQQPPEQEQTRAANAVEFGEANDNPFA